MKWVFAKCVEGSVRRSGGRVRVIAQLIDAETGNHIWAERFDRALEDVFTVQDEITDAIVTAIRPAVADAEFQRALRKPPESLGAWEAYLRGQWHYGRKQPADHERAKQFFQRAFTIDAKFSAPYVALARAYLDDTAGYGARSLEDAAELSAAGREKQLPSIPKMRTHGPWSRLRHWLPARPTRRMIKCYWREPATRTRLWHF